MVKPKAALSFINDVQVHISSISLNSRSKSNFQDSHKVVVENITLSAALSDPHKDVHHSNLLGRNQHVEAFDSDVYSVNFSVAEVRVTRTSLQDHIRLFTLNRFGLHILTTQWPSPLLVTSPFIGGDPNAPLLKMRIEIGSVHLTERAEVLSDFLSNMQPSEKKAVAQKPVAPFPLPRVMLEVNCGPILGRLLLGTESARCSHMFELRSEGIRFTLRSHFDRRSAACDDVLDDFDRLPLEMNADLSFAMESILVKTVVVTMERRQSFQFLESTGPDFFDQPPFISIDSIEIRGTGNMFADIRDDTQNTACVYPSTLLSELRCCVETVCIELWHPETIAALLRVVNLIPEPADRLNGSSPHIPLREKLPVGLTMSWSLARFVVFVTSPDINPNDDMELSRGFALRATGISVQYCALNAGHLSRCQTLHKLSLLRHDLRLPGEQGLLALKSTESSVNELWKSQSAFISISFSHVAVRSALSTQYAADDPFIAERDDTGIEVRDFLQLRSGVIQICLKSSESHPQDACEISSRIALIDISFLLAHVYSTMLGLQTIKTLSHARSRPIQTPQNTNTLLYHLDMDVDAIQANCTFGKEHVFLRLNSLSVKAISEKPVTVCLRKAVCWVRMSVVNNRWEEGRGTKWEELLSLQKWSIRLPSRKEKSILIDGETLRFRVPYGYVFANLVLDLSVAIKAIRHLHLIASNSRHSGIPSPEAEGPKQVPSIILNVSFLSLEATDDPLEVKLNRIFNAGPEAAIAREEREEAFKVKVCNILSAEGLPVPEYDGEREWEFGPKHSISIQEARSRLDGIHVLDWKQRLDIVKGNQLKAQQDFFHRLHIPYEEPEPLPVPIESCKVGNDPPLFRLSLDGLSLNVSGPSFSMDKLPEFLYQQGGLPVGTEYSLLVPMHLNFTLKSLRVTLRDYPLAMIDIPVHSDETLPAFEFDTDLVIAEEMGSELSVDWIDCPILRADEDVHDIATFSLSVPKTIMPVKTYANPEIRVTAPGITSFSWAVSYAPATQDLMRVVESLTSSPRDTSPSMGFWDKMRLIFHWSIRATFKGEVRYYMKGLRDPHDTLTAGSGFVLAWEGNTKLLVGRKNEERELVQIISDTMSIAIPKLASLPEQPAPWFRKTCAKLTSGVRFGVGFVFERTCGPSCSTCKGSSFDRQCRYFDFKPHYEVRMEKKKRVPLRNGPEDSFTKFRSDFIHLSISLTSSLRGLRPGLQQQSSSLHLTPQAFAHFWGWCSLFDNALSLPIRLGTCYPHRIISPKFGRHIATIKYRIHVPRLYVMHGYIDDSKETWIDGVTPWIGVKAMLDELQVDMHQRDQESITPGSEAAFTKVTRHKPFYAAELVMKGLDLRAIVATFPDPLKKLVELKNKQSGRSNYRSRDDFSSFEQDPSWYDPKDFVEIDWSSALEPELRVLPIASCPRVAYFKRNLAAVEETLNTSKFGNEDTHQCVLGKEPTVPQVQISLVSERIRFLKDSCKITRDENLKASRQKMVSLLEQYIAHLINVDKGGSDISGQDGSQNYQMSADFVSPHEWAEFDNVFQIHCPKIFMDSAIRDIMMQYYYCSRARRGMEYHMATRAVKFIRDQAKAALVSSEEDHSKSPAHAAASAIKRILIGENHKSTEGNVDILPTLPSSDELDPMNGWSDGVSLRKSYCCLLLKPQVVLRNRGNEKDVCVVAAVQAKLQSFRIMDDSNVDDPVSGKVMTRTYAALSGMQTFAPSFRTNAGDGCVPLEVLIDLRCESDTFERLVPQTDATFHYDKFNRLRLRNNVTSVVPRKSVESATSVNHLQDQTDLIQVNIPRFTVSATDQNFQTISHIITKLLLFSDAAHKTRLDKLETLLFTYDFTSSSSADVVAKMQRRMRLALHAERMAEKHGVMDLDMEGPTRELMKLRAHKYLISEELNLLFEAIKLAQDRSDDQGDRKSAVLLHASSSEISWRMLDESRDLLAKLSVQNIHHYWLSRQDSSTVNNLSVGNLQAFDGSKDALWAEILCKHDEPANHPLLKRRLFLLANWAVLPPVGGITIYENFEVTLHPLRLQVDARVGRRILEYLWPSRKKRRQESDGKQSEVVNDEPTRPVILPRVSLDTAIPKSPKISRELSDSSESGLVPPSLRRLGVSRSFTDLRSSAAESSPFLSRSSLQRTRSSELLRSDPDASELKDGKRFKHRHDLNQKVNKFGDAAEMKTRSSQKTFVLVRISSLHVLLSIMKEESFVCQDARIRTRDLEYRNQTTSFEELVNQFIPSDMSWKGWVKMAFHQPLVPVLPVARELISKTKWIASKGTEEAETQKPPPKQSSSKDAGQVEKETEEGRLSVSSNESLPVTNSSPAHAWKKASHRKLDTSATTITPSPLNSEPETFDSEAVTSRPTNRNRVLSVFRRKTSRTPTGIR
ncbi:Protein SABRE [Stygiomarasmius scandens]|uniref:Protein SABRE n=1 Tax=Marasmiellus scandens TaxID=2682957 RepID=A0ABR1K6N0_9AGAR